MRDMIAKFALSNGRSGVVINGAIRDREAISSLPVGVKALGSNPGRAQKKGTGEADVELNLDGVVVSPAPRCTATPTGSWWIQRATVCQISDAAAAAGAAGTQLLFMILAGQRSQDLIAAKSTTPKPDGQGCNPVRTAANSRGAGLKSPLSASDPHRQSMK